MRLSLVVAVVVLLSLNACPPAPGVDGGMGGGSGGGTGGGGGVDPFADGGCVPSVPCVPQNVCHVGTSACVIISQCVDTGVFQPVGTPCGAGFGCQVNGECSGRLTLSVSSGGNQHVYPFQRVPEPIVVRLTKSGGEPAVGERLELEVPPGLVVSPLGGVTDANGELAVRVRLGRSGLSPLVARGPMNTSLTLPIAIDFIPEGMVFDVVGESHQPGHDGLGGLAPEAHVGEIRGILDEGYTLFADDCAVLGVDPLGFLRAVAGDGVCGDAGDGALASAARLNRPTGLAALNGKHYVSDTGNHRVRVIDDATGLITTFAGGGAAPGPGWGDGQLATAATLASPGWIGVTPERDALVIADTGHDLLRRVDFATGIISTLLQPGSCDAGVAFAGCGGELGCSFSWSLVSENTIPRDYSFTVSGRVCGADVGGTAPGVVRLDGQSLGLVAGTRPPGPATPRTLSVLPLGSAPLLASMPTNRSSMALADGLGNRLWQVEPTTGMLTLVMGDGLPASTGNYVPSIGAQLGNPTGLALSYRTVLVADGVGHSLRQVGVPMELPREVTLSSRGGSGETVTQMQPTAQPFLAGLAFTLGGTLPGLPIDWRPGSHPCRAAAPSTQTDDAGVASVMARAGLLPCDLTAWFRRVHPPLTAGFGKGVNRLPSGQIATFVNERGTAVEGALPELGALATITPPSAVAGPYVVTGCAVRKLDADGYLQPFAGAPTRCGFAGDTGPGLDASFARIGGVSFDGSAVYVADTGNDRVRRIDALTGVVTTVAGGGAGVPAADGDGAQATAAILSRPEHVLVTTGSLYIADNGHNRIREVDTSTGIITSFLAPSACNGRNIAFQGCTAPRSCSLAGSTLNVYVAGNICGSGPGGPTTGIINAGIGLTHVAGRVGGATADGTLGPALSLPGEVFLGWDFDVYFAEPASHRVRRIARIGGAVSTVVGTGASGFSGDYGPVLQATLNAPAGLWLDSGSMRIADTGNAAVRAVAY